jgi:hypothetical protein
VHCGPSPVDRAAVHRMAAAGPPAEWVGLPASIGLPTYGGAR